MCIAGSRRGSGDSYQELATESQGHPRPTLVASARTSLTQRVDEQLQQERQNVEITVDSEEQNAVFIRISDNVDETTSDGEPSSLEARPDARRRLSDAELALLDCLDIGESRMRHTGRFLTMHKRRRKRLTTRGLNQEPGMLDDIFHGIAQCVLQRAGNWRFNAFTLETVTGGRSLPVLCVHLFHWYGLLQSFKLDVVTVWKLFTFIEEGYHSTNPYHNSIHATDVTQAMHCFLQEEKIRKNLTDLEIMASLIAAVTHDLDHPGVNQPFLVATSNHLAALYQNRSVLENHHWRSAIGCLLESGVSDQLAPEIRPVLQEHISSLILATDITRQQEFLTKFKHYLDNNLLNMEQPEDRHFILQIALKCADISNPCRPWDISRKWSYKVCEEFFRQGDYERQLNLPVTPLCDRYTTSIPKIQVGFFKFVVTPLYSEWHRFLGDGLSVSLMNYLKSNQKRWETMIIQENAEETRTEISELEEPEVNAPEEESAVDEVEQEEEDDLVEEEEEDDGDSGSVDLLIPITYQHSTRRTSLPALVCTQRVGRRHSVPLSVSKPLSLLARNDRRDSLPNENVHRLRNPLLKLDDQSLQEPNTLSLLSSKSSLLMESSGNAGSGERPMSAENLLPETSIASITNHAEASRLNSILQPDSQRSSSGSQSKLLTRQQTFPPLQPYVRMRYFSTTAEMAQCPRILPEVEHGSSASSACSDGCCGAQPATESENSRPRRQIVKNHSIHVDSMSKRRSSNVVDASKHSGGAQRRHSVQTLRGDDASSNSSCSRRGKRPSSAQDTDSAEVFYASLTGSSCSAKQDPVSSDNQDTTIGSNVPSKSMNSSSGNSTSIATNKLEPFVTQSAEPRRYSTPMVETLPQSNQQQYQGGRRFTTIPVSSELDAHKVFFIGSPPDSPPPRNVPSHSSSSDNSEPRSRGHSETFTDSNAPSLTVDRRDVDQTRDKSAKTAKLNSDAHMKENVDPRTGEDYGKLQQALSKRASQSWARRRGSAPVGLLSRLDDIAMTPVPRVEHNSRRGSVPTDTIIFQGRFTLGPRGDNTIAPRRASLPQDTALGSFIGNKLSLASDLENCLLINNNNNNNNNGTSNNNGVIKITDNLPTEMLSPRRGSVPADISELKRDLFNRGSVNGKNARSRKKILRRRSSGGPEMFAGGGAGTNDGNENSAWLKWKKDVGKRESVVEPTVVKRRGSLPIEVVAVSYAGSATAARRSSLRRL